MALDEPIFWMTMIYECKGCGTRHRVYLEDGCEGVSADSDRIKVPVPFTVSCSCGSYYTHISWNKDQKLSPDRMKVGIPTGAHFRYPSRAEFKKWKGQACGRAVNFRAWNKELET